MPETKTAVEWLLNAIETKNGEEFSSYYSEFIQQAKEMEKEQIIDAYEQGFDDAWGDARYDEMPTYAGPEQYYNETYGENN